MTPDNYCQQHDLLLSQLLDLGREIRILQRTLIKVVCAAVSASTAVVSALVVI